MTTTTTAAATDAPGGEAQRLRLLRWAVRAVLTLGVAASIAANVLHARPNLISQLIAAWSPLALLLTVELISRVPSHRRGLATVRLIAAAAIAVIAAWISYHHMAGVAVRYGETDTAAYLLPISVDGLVVVASVSLVEITARLHSHTSAVTQPAAVKPKQPTPPLDPQRHSSASGQNFQSSTVGQHAFDERAGRDSSSLDNDLPRRLQRTSVTDPARRQASASTATTADSNDEGMPPAGTQSGTIPPTGHSLGDQSASRATLNLVPADAMSSAASSTLTHDEDLPAEPATTNNPAYERDPVEVNVNGAISSIGVVPSGTAAAVAYWRQQDPSLHPAQIAVRIGRCERTVRRHWPQGLPLRRDPATAKQSAR